MKRPILSEFEDSQDYHIAVEEYCEYLESIIDELLNKYEPYGNDLRIPLTGE